LTEKVKIIEVYDLEMKKTGEVCFTIFSEQVVGLPRTANSLMLKNQKKTEEANLAGASTNLAGVSTNLAGVSTNLAGVSRKMKKIRICLNQAGSLHLA